MGMAMRTVGRGVGQGRVAAALRDACVSRPVLYKRKLKAQVERDESSSKKKLTLHYVRPPRNTAVEPGVEHLRIPLGDQPLAFALQRTLHGERRAQQRLGQHVDPRPRRRLRPLQRR